MLNSTHIELLYESDGGSPRDLTFAPCDKEYAVKAIEWYCESYHQLKIRAVDNDEEYEINPKDFFSHNYSYIHILGENSVNPIKRLQFYLGKTDNGKYNVELTFFPEDVSKDNNALDELNGWLTDLSTKTGISEYYLRFGWASWEYGDTSEESGVIYHTK